MLYLLYLSLKTKCWLCLHNARNMPWWKPRSRLILGVCQFSQSEAKVKVDSGGVSIQPISGNQRCPGICVDANFTINLSTDRIRWREMSNAMYGRVDWTVSFLMTKVLICNISVLYFLFYFSWGSHSLSFQPFQKYWVWLRDHVTLADKNSLWSDHCLACSPARFNEFEIQ